MLLTVRIFAPCANFYVNSSGAAGRTTTEGTEITEKTDKNITDKNIRTASIFLSENLFVSKAFSVLSVFSVVKTTLLPEEPLRGDLFG